MKKQRLIPMIIVFIMIVNCLLPMIPVKAIGNDAIYLNESLYAALKAEFRAKGIVASYSDEQHKITITEKNREKVVSLDLKNREISDLTGLENFTNLEELNLSGNRLTAESNLEVLNSFQLRRLDISSNYIEDISMIENYEKIESLSLQNQTIEKVTVLDREAIENLEEGVIKLPKILDLIENLNEFKFDDSNRIVFDIGVLSIEDILSANYDPVINNEAPHALTMNLLDEEGNINSGSIGFSIKINYGQLINTTMNLYFVIIDDDQRAAVFKDDNFYYAVKEQLTQGQDINQELDTEERDLYHRAYDIAKVMVFDIGTLINKIPSLLLSGKEIVDISGIEAFVGLEKEMDLSNNYINSIEKLVELQANKDKETTLLQERFKEQVEYVKEARAELVATLELLENIEEEIAKKLEEVEKDPTIAEKIIEFLFGYTTDKEEYIEGLNDLKNEVLAEANAALSKLKYEIKALYDIYSNYHRTTTLLTVEISELDELNFASREEAVEALKALLNKIASLEKTRSLSDFEKELLIQGMGVEELDSLGNPIELPISVHFSKILAGADKLSKGSCISLINRVMEIDTLAQLNYNIPSVYVNGEDIEFYGWNEIEIIEKSIDELLAYSSEYIEEIINRTYEFDYDGIRIASEWLDTVREESGALKVVKYTKEQQTALERENVVKEVEEGIRDIAVEVLEKMTELAKEDVHNLDNKNREVVEKFLTDPNTLKDLEYQAVENLYAEKAKTAVIDKIVEDIMKKLPESEYKTVEIPYVTSDEDVEKVLSQVLGISGKVVNLTGEEIEAWVKTPELKNINIEENAFTSLKGIESIRGLEILNAGNNEIRDISDVNWEELIDLEKLYLHENAITDISMLDVIEKLEKLNVSKNNLSGMFNLDVEKLENLKEADFSGNAYNNLRNLFVNYSIEAGREDIYKYVYREVILAKGLNFDSQYIKEDLGKVVLGEELYVKVPAIITQLERMKPADTSFDYEGAFAGKITNTGKAQLVTEELGDYKATLYAFSKNDKECFEKITYTATYEVVKGFVKDVDVFINEDRNYAILDGETEFVAIIDADSNVTDLNINWFVEGNTSTDTEINEDGVLFVAPDETAQELTVIAISNYDNSKTSKITVEVGKTDVEVVITTESNATGIKTETAKVYNALVNTEANNKDFTWSIEGNSSTGTTISEEGILYIAKDEAAGGKISIIATSDYDSEVFAKVEEIVINEEFIDPGDTTEPVEPENPGDTTEPVEPENPGDTTEPVEPENPGDTTEPVEPENPGDTTEPVEPENPGDTTVTPEKPTKEKLEIKYETKEEIVYVGKPNTTIADFVKGLVDGEHTIIVSDGKGNKITDYTKLVATGMVVAIDDDIEDTYEITVIGDINGDGKVDSVDSNLVKAHRVETEKLEGVKFEAADINKDGKVNKIDSFLLLYFRADKIDDFSKTTIDAVMK